MTQAVLSDPTRSQAVLVGVHRYTRLEDLSAVAANLEGLRTALTDPEVWGLPPEACTVLAQPDDAGTVLDTVRDKARLARDTLVVYYAGHGLTDPHTDELYLALPDSDPDREYTALRYEYLRRTVLDPQAGAQRTVVILDCCYSGRALLGRMSASAHIADQAVVDGTCVLTASAETRPALSPPGEVYTAFTGELIATLTGGVADRPDPLDMDTLYRHLHQRLASRSRPLPQQRNRNAGGLIAIARNRAVSATPRAVAAAPIDASAHAARQREAARLAALLRPGIEARKMAEQELRDQRSQLAGAVLAKLTKALETPDDTAFKPFWFAVPEPRPIFAEDGSRTSAVAKLMPGAWYLAVGRRGDALVAQTQEGRRGLLLDTRDIERAGEDGGVAIDSDFTPFWFAVPRMRELCSDDEAREPVARLMPGTWYLCAGQRDDGLVVRTRDGGQGLLRDVSDIQRG
ncbi:caspase family protein [Streptomyces justiciae]|uniref:caspase family protein n=1 Tax=Streptomyces justiciae TaxID=2780140 RepID=UPI002ADE2BA3|nr:caspase family protein [Streptomyces justiciae]